jgi:hypothetical protein
MECLSLHHVAREHGSYSVSNVCALATEEVAAIAMLGTTMTTRTSAPPLYWCLLSALVPPCTGAFPPRRDSDIASRAYGCMPVTL